MNVYAIVQLEMTNRAVYDRYQAKFMDVFTKYEGKLLAADENPKVLEGAWAMDKVVLMEFPDASSFMNWANSPEYLKISEERKAGAKATVLLVQGLQ